MSNIKFKIPYSGGRSIIINGEIVGYIDRSYDGGWNWEGRNFGLLSEAKATIKYELIECDNDDGRGEQG